MTEQEQHKQQLQDQATDNGQPPPGTVEDRAELALAGRITVLEEWRPRVGSALGLMIVAVAALAFAVITSMLLLRRNRQ